MLSAQVGQRVPGGSFDRRERDFDPRLTPRIGVSTRCWQFAAPDDPRLTIEPDIAIPVTASDYFAGRDPTLEAVLAAR